MTGDYQELNGTYALVSASSGNHVCRLYDCFTGRTTDGRFLTPIGERRDVAQVVGALICLEGPDKRRQKLAQEFFNRKGIKPLHVVTRVIAFLITSSVQGFLFDLPLAKHSDLQSDRNKQIFLKK